MKQNFEKVEAKKRPRVNPQVAVNMGKCAACPLVNLWQAARLKRPDIVNDDNCQAVVEHMESDLGGGEYLPSTKEQFNDNSRNMVFATDLHRVPSQKQNIEKQKQLERIAAEKKHRAEQQRDLQLKRQREQQANVRARQKMHQNKLQQEKARSVKRNQSRGKENSFLGEMVRVLVEPFCRTLGKRATQAAGVVAKRS